MLFDFLRIERILEFQRFYDRMIEMFNSQLDQQDVQFYSDKYQCYEEVLFSKSITQRKFSMYGSHPVH